MKWDIYYIPNLLDDIRYSVKTYENQCGQTTKPNICGLWTMTTLESQRGIGGLVVDAGGYICFIWVYNHTHRIHGAGIYASIWGILMVNVTIYSIHGSYGIIISMGL